MKLAIVGVIVVVICVLIQWAWHKVSKAIDAMEDIER